MGKQHEEFAQFMKVFFGTEKFKGACHSDRYSSSSFNVDCGLPKENKYD
jgi:hypothetical protein